MWRDDMNAFQCVADKVGVNGMHHNMSNRNKLDSEQHYSESTILSRWYFIKLLKTRMFLAQRSCFPAMDKPWFCKIFDNTSQLNNSVCLKSPWFEIFCLPFETTIATKTHLSLAVFLQRFFTEDVFPQKRVQWTMWCPLPWKNLFSEKLCEQTLQGEDMLWTQVVSFDSPLIKMYPQKFHPFLLPSHELTFNQWMSPQKFKKHGNWVLTFFQEDYQIFMECFNITARVRVQRPFSSILSCTRDYEGFHPIKRR